MFSLINIIILKTSTSTWWTQTPPRSPSPLTITTNPFALSTFSLWFNCHYFVYFTAYHTNISQAVYQLDGLQLWSKIIPILNGTCPKLLNFGKINQPNAAWSHLDVSVNYVIVGLDGSLPLTVRQALIWINDFLLLIAILGTSRYSVKICLIEQRFENTHFKLAAIFFRSRWVNALSMFVRHGFNWLTYRFTSSLVRMIWHAQPGEESFLFTHGRLGSISLRQWSLGSISTLGKWGLTPFT